MTRKFSLAKLQGPKLAEQLGAAEKLFPWVRNL